MLGIGLELAAEAGDTVVDGAVVAVVVAGRGEAHELVAGEHPAGVGGEGGDEVDLHRAEVDRPAGRVEKAEGAEVEPEGPEGDTLDRSLPRGAAAQDRGDAGGELGQLDRLGRGSRRRRSPGRPPGRRGRRRR